MKNSIYSFKIHTIRDILFALFGLLLISSCSKLVEVDTPVTQLSSENVFQNDNTAASVMTELYSDIGNTTMFLISKNCGLSADEISLSNTVTNGDLLYYSNQLTSPIGSNGGGAGFEVWNLAFNNILICNTTIDGANKSTMLSSAVKKQLIGEAKFMRGLLYFYLVNLYGDLPLVISPDYNVNRLLSRSSQDVIYNQIILDLKDAKSLLSSQFLGANLLTTTADRVRPTSWAASALLARTYLYTSDFTNAELEATNVLNNTTVFDTASINSVFLKNSKEAIFQLQPVFALQNTWEGSVFVLPSTGVSNSFPYSLSNQTIAAFESNDQRKTIGNWVSSRTVGTTVYNFPFKYKLGLNSTPGSEYQMILRVGEVYLIRAEARAQLNNISGAQSDLNLIRKRARLQATTANDKTTLMSSILHERQTELFTEMGHRWLDLKRSKTIDAIMSIVTPQKASVPWSTNQQLYPLPYSDILRNSNLKQNPGYPQ